MKYLTSNIIINEESNDARMIYCLPIVQYYKNSTPSRATRNVDLCFYQNVTTRTHSYGVQVAFYYDPDDVEINSDFNQIKQLMDASIIGIIE